MEKLSPDEQKNINGNILFPMIKKEIESQPAYASQSNDLTPKVTGMLIDLEVLNYNDIYESIHEPTVLRSRVSEALELINMKNQAE